MCGLPQIVYSADEAAGQGQPEHEDGPVRDAGSIDWKPALRLAMALAIPAGVLSSMFSPFGILGPLLMGAASAWVIALYLRGQRPAWITLGAGARIGLVTGILGSWVAALITGVTLYIERYWMHQAKAFDDLWQAQVDQMSQQLASMGFDPQKVAEQKALMLSPQGHAGEMLFEVLLLAAILLIFAIAGGAIGARFLGRPRQPQS
ncbi:MAG: hypothetical protein ABSF23_08820 [Terracidiphilus sp.]